MGAACVLLTTLLRLAEISQLWKRHCPLQKNPEVSSGCLGRVVS